MALLWDRHSALVRGLLRRSLGPDAQVEDLVQDVFLRFLRSAQGIQEPGRVDSYLVSIALNRLRSELRRRKVRRCVGLSPTGELPEVGDRGVDIEGRDALRRLYAILDELSTNARLAFVLRYVEELPLVEVAEKMGWSLSTAKRRIARARTTVRARAEADPGLAYYLRAA